MADEKKSEGLVTLLNKGARVWDHGFEEKGGKKVARKHLPGTTMTFTAEEAKKLDGYKELVDITKLPGQLDLKKVIAENTKLLDENKRLREQLLALQSKSDESGEDKGRKDRKEK